MDIVQNSIRVRCQTADVNRVRAAASIHVGGRARRPNIDGIVFALTKDVQCRAVVKDVDGVVAIAAIDGGGRTSIGDVNDVVAALTVDCRGVRVRR